MSMIVAARFTTFEQAELASNALFQAGFAEEDVTLFFVNPRGQHAQLATGGDRKNDPSAKRAPKGAGKGVAIGAALGAIVGGVIFASVYPSAIVAGLAAGVGAYVGSLIGAMVHTRHSAETTSPEDPAVRNSGVLLAVHVSPDTQVRAATLLEKSGGAEIERATGRWQQGKWSDFDPLKPPEVAPELAEQHA